jgi:hypothetical protein
MLDVHPAHHAANSWREFFVHIATIVLGLLIAVGLEQTIEFFHRHHQVHQMEDNLRAESLENRHTVADDLPAIHAMLSAVDANIATLQLHRSAGEKDPLVLAPFPNVRIFVPIDAAWLGMRDSALLSIVPRQLSTNYWKLDFLIQSANNHLQDVTRSRDKVAAIKSLQTLSAPLTAAERNELLLAFSEYRQQIDRLRNTLVGLDLSIGIALESKDLTVESTNDAYDHASNKQQ